MQIKRRAEMHAQAVSHNPAISKWTWLQQGDVAGITQFAQAVFPAGERAPGHVHPDMTEVFMVQAGMGVMQLSNQILFLHAGDCIVIEAGEWHELQNNSREPFVVTYFGVKTPPAIST